MAVASSSRRAGIGAVVVTLALLAEACSIGSPTKAGSVNGTGSTVSTTGAASPAVAVSPAPPTGPDGNGPTTNSSVVLTPAFTAPPPQTATTLPVPTTIPQTVNIPILRIITPKSGDVVSPPIPVQYDVSGFDVGAGRGAMQLTLGDGGGFGVSLALDGPSGVVYLDDLRLSGNRTLVFTLITPDGHALTNLEATVRIPAVTLEGRK